MKTINHLHKKMVASLQMRPITLVRLHQKQANNTHKKRKALQSREGFPILQNNT